MREGNRACVVWQCVSSQNQNVIGSDLTLANRLRRVRVTVMVNESIAWALHYLSRSVDERKRLPIPSGGALYYPGGCCFQCGRKVRARDAQTDNCRAGCDESRHVSLTETSSHNVSSFGSISQNLSDGACRRRAQARSPGRLVLVIPKVALLSLKHAFRNGAVLGLGLRVSCFVSSAAE
eukprot:5275017-Pleurochrysis_carterae.AAC.1